MVDSGCKGHGLLVTRAADLPRKSDRADRAVRTPVPC